MFQSASILILITGLYPIAGGLRAVVYTELIQTFVLIFASLTLTIFGLVKVGGWDELTERVPRKFFSMWKSFEHPNFPWTGIGFGAAILGICYWSTDQYIVQRVLAARSKEDARRGAIFPGYLKILPVFIFVLPGIIATALYPEISGEGSDRAFSVLVTRLLPPGLRGIVVAGLLAALMSSLNSAFNSCSTLRTWDFYRKLKPHASECELVTVGRIATAFLVVLGFLWIPFMKHISSQLYVYLQCVQAYISPPITACFLFGIFTSRVNSSEAIASLIAGFILGRLRLTLELMNSFGFLPQDSIWTRIAEINFLQFAVLLFAICTFILFTVSGIFSSKESKKVNDLIISKDIFLGKKLDESNIILSIVLALTIVVLGIIFA